MLKKVTYTLIFVLIILSVSKLKVSKADEIKSALNSNESVNLKNDTKINEEWGKTYGGGKYDVLNDVEETKDGEYIAVGEIGSNEDKDGLIVKFDNKGNEEWERTYGGGKYDVLNDVEESGDGGYIAVGETESSDGDIKGGNKGGKDGLIVKFDEEGNEEWERTCGGKTEEYFKGVEVTKDGGYIAAGYTGSNDGDIKDGNSGGYDGLVVKFDGEGNEEWERTYGGSTNDYFEDIKETHEGGYIAVGGFDSSNLDIKADINSNNGGLIVKFDSKGNIEYQETHEGYFENVEECKDGGYIAAGFTYSTSEDHREGSNDALIVKYDNEFNEEWERTYGGSGEDLFYDIEENVDGGYIAAGYTRSNDGDIKGGNKSDADGLIVKFDEEGNEDWERTYGANVEDLFYDIEESADGEYITVGITRSNGEGIKDGNKSDADGLIVKFNENELNIIITLIIEGITKYNILISMVCILIIILVLKRRRVKQLKYNSAVK